MSDMFWPSLAPCTIRLRTTQDPLQQIHSPLSDARHRLPGIGWSRLGVFDRIFSVLVAEADCPDTLMIDATHLHPTAKRPELSCGLL